MWQLTDKEFAAVTSLGDARRVEYAVKRIADTREVWLLCDEHGLWKVSTTGAGTECVPVWPHRRYAEASSAGAWAGARAAKIDLEEFMDKWLPGMQKDCRQVAIFPVDGAKAVVVPPQEFREMLDSELSKY